MYSETTMNILYTTVFASLLQLPQKSLGLENNVCNTIQDYYTIINNRNCEYDVAADPNSDPITIIEYYGYPAEKHIVTTLDGYILTMFRIPKNQVGSNKNPVFLQHGLMCSAATFLGLGKNSLAFVLADAGYDVWLGNYRGTEYSEGHINMTVFDEKYWNYSIDDIALYDIPAQLDYISKTMAHTREIIYIGHSLGSRVALMYSSTYPKQAGERLKLMILLAPAAHSPNVKSPIFRYMKTPQRALLKTIMDAHATTVVSQAKYLKALTRKICFISPLALLGCSKTVNSVFAGPQSQVDTKTLPVMFNQIPAGSSFKILVQLADFAMGYFRRYNYGLENFKIYDSNEPPNYNLSKIEVPVFLIYAINDWATAPQDSINLYQKLSERVRYGSYEIKVPNFNHLDFLYGNNAKSIVYDVVLQVLEDVE